MTTQALRELRDKASHHECELCGVPEGDGWCGNCCRAADDASADMLTLPNALIKEDRT